MGGQPCYYKLIMNGHRVGANTEILLGQVLAAQADGTEISDDDAYKVIKHLNTAEDCTNKATKAFLDAVKYDGPVDHSLSFKE